MSYKKIQKISINHTCLKSLSNLIWLCGISRATSCWGQYLDVKGKGYSGHLRNLKPLERYLSASQISTFSNIRNFRFSIFLKTSMCSCTFTGSGGWNRMPQILSDA